MALFCSYWYSKMFDFAENLVDICCTMAVKNLTIATKSLGLKPGMYYSFILV
uniref:Uncharacterized protein n=1 Tax=Rhizophora mucronata TaxID=61149 RepID=A0A2P2NB14_RHIMU